VYLLSLALRVLTLIGVGGARTATEGGVEVAGRVCRSAGRKTARPSAELLLKAMKTISVSVVEVTARRGRLLSPLTEVQKRLLQLWGNAI